MSVTDDPLVGDDDEVLGHLSLTFSKQSSSYYQQLVLALQMWSKYIRSSPMNIYFGSNAQAGVNGNYTLF